MWVISGSDLKPITGYKFTERIALSLEESLRIEKKDTKKTFFLKLKFFSRPVCYFPLRSEGGAKSCRKTA